MIRFVWLAGIALFSNVALAEMSPPPEKLTHAGKTYSLAFKNIAPNGQSIFEYTTNNESIEQWTTLVTINYAKGVTTQPLKWLESIKYALDHESPKPNYDLFVKENNGYARVIYEPTPNYSTYESNVQKSFHIDKCDGLVVYQFAQKYPQSTNKSDEGKLETLRSIAIENTTFAGEIDKSGWSPICN